ncbi:AMP-binding protein [Nonomuraea sp. NPDC005650]|uniref:class I adenylate-forming enzyme family protein n=1 Tax=Nonomuraea sp. NPDC005650 TaxID=3157045 RepID=UPI0033B223BF
MLVCGDRTVSRAELTALADGRAARLAACGIGQGDLVGLCLPNGCEWVVTYLALARLQACCVPLNAASAVAEIVHVVRDCGMRALFVSADRAEALEERCADQVLLCPDGTVPRNRRAPERGSRQAAPAGAACLAYTSGTTGSPKGVVQTWRAVRAGGSNLAGRLRLGPRDRVVTALPLAHTYGTNVMNAALGSGAGLILLERFDVATMLERSARHAATVMAGVPTMYRRLLAHPDGRMPRSLRCGLSAGQCAGEDLAMAWEERTGAPYVEGWGMTELGGMATLAAPELPGRHGTAGTALPGVRLRVVTSQAPEHEVPGVRLRAAASDGVVPAGEPGELQVHGPIVTPGYWNSPRQTAAAIGADGWLRTGDVGVITHDGRVRIVDRIKDVVLCGGYSVFPAELERAIRGHPAVRDVAVAGLPDPILGEIPCAWVVPEPGSVPTSEEIIGHCRTLLATHKLPRRVVLVTGLPVTANGKVDRRALTSTTSGRQSACP